MCNPKYDKYYSKIKEMEHDELVVQASMYYLESFEAHRRIRTLERSLRKASASERKAPKKKVKVKS